VRWLRSPPVNGRTIPSFMVVLAAALAALAGASSGTLPITKVRDLSLELVGQVTNSPAGVTPPTSIQVGYVSYLRGFPIFKDEPNNENSALLTFSLEATTLRVISDGPLRIVTRTGKMTLFSDPDANSNFADVHSFSDGKPFLIAGLRQQVVIDTASSTFTTHNLNTVISTSPFRLGGRTVQLGYLHERFETVLAGHLNMPGPPSGYFAGWTSKGSAPAKPNH
jgi:hypothetical protein